MRYMRLKKQEGVRLFKDIVFSKITLDFLHNSRVEGCAAWYWLKKSSFDRLRTNGYRCLIGTLNYERLCI
jgi:hypothetical protein